MNENEVETILTGICVGLNPQTSNPEIMSISAKSLRDSLFFSKGIFAKEKYLNYVLELVLKACLIDSLDINVVSLQCMSELCTLVYQHLTVGHFETISNKITPLFKNQDREVVIAVTEFWSSIARLEIDLDKPENKFWPNSVKLQGVIDNCLSSILPSVLMNLINELGEADSEDDEGAGNSISKASQDLLVLMNRVSTPDSATKIYMEFIGKYIGSDNEQEKITALLAYQSMIIGLPESSTNDIVSSSIHNLFGLIQNTPEVNFSIFFDFNLNFRSTEQSSTSSEP